MEVWPSEDKVVKWTADVHGAILSRKLSSREAAKLAGRLGFTAQNAFQNVGRAPLRPIFRHQYSPLPHGRVSNLLLAALVWWEAFLVSPIKKKVLFAPPCRCIHIFTDARSTPPRLSAVAQLDGKTVYTDLAPAASLLALLKPRADQQIMALEILAVILGLQTIGPLVVDACVHVWVDNTAGEAVLAKGAARSEDHNAFAHVAWLLAARDGFSLSFHRVGTKDNIADLPSREVYCGFLCDDAVWIDPILVIDSTLLPFFSPSSPRVPSRAACPPPLNLRFRPPDNNRQNDNEGWVNDTDPKGLSFSYGVRFECLSILQVQRTSEGGCSYCHSAL